MRVDNVIIDVAKSVAQILLALDNRLTASENLQGEGTAGQVLTSNGPNSAPSYQAIPTVDITAEVERILREHELIT